MGKIVIGTPQTFEPLENGWYEVFLEKYDEPVDKGAYEESRMQFSVRDDLPEFEENANRKVFANIRDSWGWLFSALGHACKIPKDTEFESLGEFLEAIKGASLRVRIKQEEYQDKVYANIKGYEPTEEMPYTPAIDENAVGGDDSII